VVVPISPDEALSAFGDGTGVTVVGGGTIVMPEITAGRLLPKRAILLGRAGLDNVEHKAGKWTIGAAAPIEALIGAPEPLGNAARAVGDREIRAQGTVGGNLCADRAHDYPRGDLQAALIALDAEIRSSGKGGDRTEPVEKFLAGDRARRLVLEVTLDATGRRGAWAALERPHAHAYTALAVAGATTPDGKVRLAACGVASHAVRLAAAEGGKADQAVKGVEFADDALASAWYREQMLPVLVARVLAELKED
jgi:CO/xanthine dehydrogenase FAD-binding subunit